MAIRKSLHVCVSLPLSKARRLEASCAILRCEGWPYTKVWRASRGDGCHGYPSQVLTSYRPSGTSRLKEGFLSMRREHSNKNTPRRPLCPSCAQIMQLVRATSRFEELPDLYTFECRACGLSHIETA